MQHRADIIVSVVGDVVCLDEKVVLGEFPMLFSCRFWYRDGSRWCVAATVGRCWQKVVSISFATVGRSLYDAGIPRHRAT